MLVDPSPLLGQIQRGRGAGFPAAPATDPAFVAPSPWHASPMIPALIVKATAAVTINLWC